MKAALRPALPLLIGIALAAVLALVAMHSLTFGPSASVVGSHHSFGSHHSVGYTTDAAHDIGQQAHLATHDPDIATNAAHNHGASAVCASSDGAECCSFVANASGAQPNTLHASPGTTVSPLGTSAPVASLLATEAAERPPSRMFLAVIRV